MTVLDQILERTIVIRARRETVFRYFTDSARWAAWWGAGSSIDPTVGGRVVIRYPDGTEAVGDVVEIAPPERVVFTYGYTSGKLVPPGGSRVTIRLEAEADGTRVHLTHAFSEPAVRDHHVQGWRYQLSLFSNVVVNDLHANAADLADAWFAVWGLRDEAERDAALRKIVAPDVTFRDPYSSVDGIAELHAQIGGAIRFMPRVRLERTGRVRQCQGTVLADWKATGLGPDGTVEAAGTNVFVLNADGRITSAVGIWN